MDIVDIHNEQMFMFIYFTANAIKLATVPYYF